MQVKERQGKQLIWFLSVAVVVAVAYLLYNARQITQFDEDIYIIPRINAVLNSATALLLLVGLYFIRKRQWKAHRNTMVGAFGLSAVFLVLYVVYHYQAPQVHFGGEGFIRYLYFFVLISHILLAIFIVPLVLFTLFRAFTNDFYRHRKIAKITWPIWFYVAVTGVIVYFMISPYYPA